MDSSHETRSDQRYFDEHHISDYLQDALDRLLVSKAEKPLQYLSDYFEIVSIGHQIILRDFDFVKLTPKNMSDFIARLQEITDKKSSLTPYEFHQFLLLICPDFPLGIIKTLSNYIQYRNQVKTSTIASKKQETVSFTETSYPTTELIQGLNTYLTLTDYFEAHSKWLSTLPIPKNEKNLIASHPWKFPDYQDQVIYIVSNFFGSNSKLSEMISQMKSLFFTNASPLRLGSDQETNEEVCLEGNEEGDAFDWIGYTIWSTILCSQNVS